MNEKERRAKEAIQAALANFASEPFEQASLKLFDSTDTLSVAFSFFTILSA